MSLPQNLPRWALDLVRFLPLKSQFLLSGNVRDRHPWEAAPGRFQPLPLQIYLAELLRGAGVARVLAFDPVNGFSIPLTAGLDLAAERKALDFLGLTWNDQGRAPATVARFFELLPALLRREGEPVALLADFSSRYLVRPDLPSGDEHAWFTTALVLSHEVKPRPVGPGGTPLFHPLIWIAEKEGDLPPWLVVGNPRLRGINVPTPDRPTRARVAGTLVTGLPDARQAGAEAQAEAARILVDQTEGLLMLDLVAIIDLCRREGVGISQMEDGVRRYKLGVTENPWAKLDRSKIAEGDRFILNRLKGQTQAVTKMLDIVKRAVMGLSGNAGGSGRPRGVAFLAGPTGTGKTELAKTITELLFGDEGAYIRFDMSEFSAEHADQRLIGAPPGYVGYDVGGELTNAIREKPFSVVLFDEIEKAHPRILDKFLQVLDDGVLTSGRGERVYFSEALIIFTSNLGISRLGPDGARVANTSPADSFEEVQRKVRGEIDRFFKLELGRPEILNRIGENIVVFDFIRPEVGQAIFTMMVEGILRRVRTAAGREVRLEEGARAALRELCLADLTNGGRGIRNQLEAHFVNPLARALFEQVGGGPVTIKAVVSRGGLTSIELA